MNLTAAPRSAARGIADELMGQLKVTFECSNRLFALLLWLRARFYQAARDGLGKQLLSKILWRRAGLEESAFSDSSTAPIPLRLLNFRGDWPEARPLSSRRRCSSLRREGERPLGESTSVMWVAAGRLAARRNSWGRGSSLAVCCVEWRVFSASGSSKRLCLARRTASGCGGPATRERGACISNLLSIGYKLQSYQLVLSAVSADCSPPAPPNSPLAFPRPPELYLMDLSKYSSERLMAANEVELKAILQEYKQEQLPAWKFALFVGYNALSLAGMYAYGVRLRGERAEPSLRERSRFTIPRLFRRGVTHSLVMIGIYSAGLAAVCSETLSFSLLRKLTEIQSTYHSFGLKFDPSYQDYLLFSRMRRFDLSEGLIDDIRAELAAERQRLIQTGGLLPETVKKIQEAERLFKDREKELR